MIRQLSQAVHDHEKAQFKAFFMFIQDTPERLKALNQQEKADNVALTLLQGKNDPTLKAYAINSDPAVKSTVIVYKMRQVTRVFVNYDPGRDAAALRQAIAEATR